MITQTRPQSIATVAIEYTTPQWKIELRDAFTHIEPLLAALNIEIAPKELSLISQFPLRVPQFFASLMAQGDMNDPLLKQVLPLAAEQHSSDHYVHDPLQESQHKPAPGIIHKYYGRVLLITTPVCAVHCRYCFRRHFPYSENTLSKVQWLASLAYVRDNPSISEVILSGGDPLASDDRHLSWLVAEIEKIPHIRRLRLHTRLPVVIPSRLNKQCLAWMAKSPLKIIMVLHINHANEISGELSTALQPFRQQGITLLNQSVLLKGVNDNAPSLCQLSEALFEAGILPYYLHLFDPVANAEHFDASDTKARELYKEIQAQLPGYLLPKLVKDISGKAAKTLINASL